MRSPLKTAALLVVLGVLLAAAGGLWPGAIRHEASAPVQLGASAAGAQPPAWAIDPTLAGESLPPVGRSLFDFLVMDGESVKVPFPFEALTRKIDSRLGCVADGPMAPRGAGSGTAEASCLKRVLIPLGRSLQRTAAAPEFFKYPRAVVAVGSEPPAAAAPARHRPLLKDRLYLGYQEKSDLIEVISYNEAAGRFEFQLVKDYRAGATPKVLYANRAVCVACHQNHAPLFSRPLWDETNANPRIAARLTAQRRVFYGIPVSRGVDIPNALDDSTDRANLFSVHHKLWREGCEDARDSRKSRRCRGALLKALLQYRLSGERGFDQATPTYRGDLLGLLGQTVKERWPGGLAIPNPDIPNRDPLPGAADGTRAAGATALAHVPALFEPLAPREPLEIWPADAADYARRTIAGLSQFIAEEDVQRLDDHLFALGSKPGAPRRTWSTDCRFIFSRPSSFMQRLDFRCPAKDGGESAMRLVGHLDMPAGKAMTGTVTRLGMSGIAGDCGEFELHAGRAELRNGQSALVTRAIREGRRVRLIDGNAVDSISLRWRGAGFPEHGPRGAAVEIEGQVTVNALDDFAAFSAALAQLVENDSAAGDLLAAKPFRRAAVLPALFTLLGLPAGEWCCLDDRAMAPARLDTGERMSRQAPAGTPRFYQYCATCHLTPERSPPNFLYGNADQVAANLRHCAERIYFRLSMWRQAPGARPKTPMPPGLALQSLGTAPEHWPDSAELAELTRYTADLLRTKQGSAPGIEQLVAGGYEALRPCLPEPK
jgi:hypothetical protein